MIAGCPKATEQRDTRHDNGLPVELSHFCRPALAVSAPDEFHEENIKTVTSEDIHRLVSSYAQDAKRVQEAGFDGIEIRTRLHSHAGNIIPLSLPLYQFALTGKVIDVAYADMLMNKVYL